MIPKQIPLQLLSYVYPGTHRDWWRKRANSGLLGAVSVEPGHVRNRLVDTAEVVSRFGTISEERFAAAMEAYERARKLIRRVTP